MTRVLITGATGHVGVFTVADFVKRGYSVNTTLRSFSKVEQTKQMIQKAGELSLEQMAAIKFFEADLEKEEGWEEAIAGCSKVIHIAFPFIMGKPLEDLYKAGVDGSLRVLKLANASPTVDHFVYCSTFGTIALGDVPEGHVLDENDWSPVGAFDGYVDAKIIVEKKFWEYVQSEENTKSEYPVELTTLHPCGIFGPLPEGYTNYAGVLPMIKAALEGKGPIPLCYAWVTDVRDLADSFVKAVEIDEAKGERFFVLSDEEIQLADAYRWMKEAHPAIPEVTETTPLFFGSTKTTNAKAKRILGYSPRPVKESLLATAQSLLQARAS